MPEVKTIYGAAGGMPFFEALVGAFYAGVEADPVLLRLYPDPTDLGPARRRLTLFLAQYWGGPTTYSDERGHPRLRARHFPFEIGPDERDHWLAAMRAAIERVAPSPVVRQELERYFGMAAEAMRNQG
jgi:hemoglobin